MDLARAVGEEMKDVFNSQTLAQVAKALQTRKQA